MIFFFDKLEKLLLIIIILICVIALGVSGFFSVFTENNQNPMEYHVSDSTFKIHNWWNVINSSNDSVEFSADEHSELGDNPYPIYLRLTQHTNTAMLESKYQNSLSSSDDYRIKTENKIIQGIEVRFINSTDTTSNTTFLDYFFQKNGKYYSIHIKGDTFPVNNLHDDRIEITVELIISTIN